MKRISTVYPNSTNFLNIDAIDEFCFHIGGDSSALKNEFLVIKPMLQSKKVNNVIELYNELISMSDAFPQTLKNDNQCQFHNDLTVMAIERDFEINYERGWAGHNEVYMNGKCSKNVNGYTSDYSKGDVIELILDCDHHLIRMTNIRSTKSYEINVDLKDCPFSWMLPLNIFHHETRIRANPLNVSRKQ
ncbi:unnamed protein product [Rotaria socialis]